MLYSSLWEKKGDFWIMLVINLQGYGEISIYYPYLRFLFEISFYVWNIGQSSFLACQYTYSVCMVCLYFLRLTFSLHSLILSHSFLCNGQLSCLFHFGGCSMLINLPCECEATLP